MESDEVVLREQIAKEVESALAWIPQGFDPAYSVGYQHAARDAVYVILGGSAR